MKTTHTPGTWDFACDSYGKVRHSRKACVYTVTRHPDGERIETVAARIPNWSDARLIAAAPELLEALQSLMVEIGERAPAGAYGRSAYKAQAAIAKATGSAEPPTQPGVIPA